MCGICGIFCHLGSAPRETVQKMANSMMYRGPDDHGVYNIQGSDFNLCLGHCRLAILDLTGNRQPMVSPITGTAVTFNGEIYNFRSLKTELENLGYQFITSGDTEVLVHGYDAWGMEGLIHRIDGMYAFALWDHRLSQLFLARDPAGQKPLLYSRGPDGQMAFASTMTALRLVQWFTSDIDLEALELFLCLRYVPAPKTVFKNVRKVRPGEVLCWRNHELRTLLRFDPLDTLGRVIPQQGNWELEFAVRLEQCVQECLVADVPVSLLLSSGLDSAVIAEALSGMKRAVAVRCFTAGFAGTGEDETPRAAQLTSILNLEHTTLSVDGEAMHKAFQDLGLQMDEPFGDPSAVPALAICSLVAQQAKVAIGGDGGDELFCGYQTFQAITPWQWMRRVPALGLARMLTTLLPVSDDPYSSRVKAERFFYGLGHPPARAFVRWLCHFSPEQAGLLLGTDGGAVDRLADSESPTADLDPMTLMSVLYFRIFLPSVLEKMDRSSMHHSLETRAPLLQKSILALGFSMPWQLKFYRGTTKVLLRNYMSRRVPHLDWKAPKRGFLPPLAQWMRNGFETRIKQSVQDGLFSNYLDRKQLDGILQEHEMGRVNHSQRLWIIYSLGLFLARMQGNVTCGATWESG